MLSLRSQWTLTHWLCNNKTCLIKLSMCLSGHSGERMLRSVESSISGQVRKWNESSLVNQSEALVSLKSTFKIGSDSSKPLIISLNSLTLWSTCTNSKLMVIGDMLQTNRSLETRATTKTILLTLQTKKPFCKFWKKTLIFNNLKLSHKLLSQMLRLTRLRFCFIKCSRLFRWMWYQMEIKQTHNSSRLSSLTSNSSISYKPSKLLIRSSNSRPLKGWTKINSNC